MNVLSLFDGISCGQLALHRARVRIDSYYASEIDKYALKVTNKNYPDTIQLGNVTEWEKWNLPNIDLLIGGSPCQGFSISGHQLNFEDPRSKLFFEYVAILTAYKPKYFLLENVKMKQECQDVITKYLGVQPIKINSALVSAQNRERLYWTNISGVEQPEDKHILLKDVIENGFVDRDKSFCIDACYYKGGNSKQYYEKHRRQLVFKDKNKVLSTSYRQNASIVATGKTTDFNSYFRKLTPLECERLQTLPDGYTEGISNTQRYKCLGNGWTVDVIAHILSYLPEKYITVVKDSDSGE